jgi:hypothetical protein
MAKLPVFLDQHVHFYLNGREIATRYVWSQLQTEVPRVKSYQCLDIQGKKKFFQVTSRVLGEVTNMTRHIYVNLKKANMP